MILAVLTAARIWSEMGRLNTLNALAWKVFDVHPAKQNGTAAHTPPSQLLFTNYLVFGHLDPTFAAVAGQFITPP